MLLAILSVCFSYLTRFFPQQHTKFVERQLLTGIANQVQQLISRRQFQANPSLFALAFQNLNRPLRMLYVHAAQSLIWNEIATWRWSQSQSSEDPLRDIRVGDLVWIPMQSSSSSASPTSESAAEQDDQTPEDEAAGEERLRVGENGRVHVVTEQDVQDRKFSLHQIVLPLLGSNDDLLPSLRDLPVFQESRRLADHHGVSALYEKPHDELAKFAPDLIMPGSYRHLLTRPMSIDWEFKSYDHPDQQLVLTDLDHLLDLPLPEIPHGPRTALVLKFQLPSSCYATMLFRELLHSTTETGNQRALSQAQQQQMS